MIGYIPLLITAIFPKDSFFINYLSNSSQWLKWVWLLACFVFAGIGAYYGMKFGCRITSTGILQLYNDYATLQYGKNKELMLKRNELSLINSYDLSSWRSRNPKKNWTIRVDHHTITFNEVLIKGKKDKVGIYVNSLCAAMKELEASGLPRTNN